VLQIYVGDDVYHAINLFPRNNLSSQKDKDINVRIFRGISSCPRTVKHNVLQSVTVKLFELLSEFSKYVSYAHDTPLNYLLVQVAAYLKKRFGKI